MSVAEPICSRIIAFLLLIHYFTLWHWPLTFDLKHLQCRHPIVCVVTRDETVLNLNAIKQSATESTRFQYLTLYPWTCCKCCARFGDNFHQVWSSTTYPCLNYSVFWCWYVMSSCDLDLWPVDIERWMWYINVRQSLYEIWAKSINPRLNYW